MLRLTTNVTVSPASSARSSSAAWRISSIASARVSANSAVSSSALSAAPRGPARSRRPRARGGSAHGGSVRPDPRRGMKLQYLTLIVSITPCAIHSGRCTCGYTHSRSVSAIAVALQLLAHLVRRGERVLRGDVVAVGAQARRGRSRPRPPAPPTSPQGSAGSGSRRPASAGGSLRSVASCPRCSPRRPTRAAAAAAGRPPTPVRQYSRAAASAICAGSWP